MYRQNRETAVTGYSIWLIPNPDSCTPIQQMINDLSGQFNAPLFRPHLTLLGQIQGKPESIIPVFQELVRSCSAIRLIPERIDIQDVFYRSLYYEIHASIELTALNNIARSKFNREADKPFFPHISLLYSFASASEKRKIIRAFQVPDEITVDRIELMKTQGEVRDWDLVESIELLR